MSRIHNAEHLHDYRCLHNVLLTPSVTSRETPQSWQLNFQLDMAKLDASELTHHTECPNVPVGLQICAVHELYACFFPLCPMVLLPGGYIISKKSHVNT